MNKANIKFPANVLVIDTYFLNQLIVDMKQFYEEKLKREIAKIDIPYLLDYFSLDMQVKGGDQKCLVIWVYDSKSEKIAFGSPSDIADELSSKGFDDQIAHFEMIGAPCKQLATRKELMMNIIELVANSKEVKRIGVLPELHTYTEEVCNQLKGLKETTSVVFVPNPQETVPTEHIRFESVFYPILAGMGFKSEEL